MGIGFSRSDIGVVAYINIMDKFKMETKFGFFNRLIQAFVLFWLKTVVLWYDKHDI